MSALMPGDFRYQIPRCNGSRRENNERLAAVQAEFAAVRFRAPASRPAPVLGF